MRPSCARQIRAVLDFRIRAKRHSKNVGAGDRYKTRSKRARSAIYGVLGRAVSNGNEKVRMRSMLDVQPSNVLALIAQDRVNAPISMAGKSWLHIFALLLFSVATGNAFAQSSSPADAPSVADELRWAALKQHYFGDNEIVPGQRVIALVAPEHAENAAIVPVTVRATFPQSESRYVKTITLLVDNNPAPLAGRFHLTPASGKANISTRIRINDFTHVRAIAELNDGSLHMAKRYVRASGGCSAPVPRDVEATAARLGKIKLKRPINELLGHPNRAKLMIGHPNYSGMQMDSKTKAYIPAEFVKEVEVRHAGELVMRVESDISISEDPSFQFYYSPMTPGELSVSVRDSAERSFNEEWPSASK